MLATNNCKTERIICPNGAETYRKYNDHGSLIYEKSPRINPWAHLIMVVSYTRYLTSFPLCYRTLTVAKLISQGEKVHPDWTG